jgi:hypothetical protein
MLQLARPGEKFAEKSCAFMHPRDRIKICGLRRHWPEVGFEDIISDFLQARFGEERLRLASWVRRSSAVQEFA